MDDYKKSTSWMYAVNKVDLVAELERRGLPIEGSFAVLRERLVKSEREDADTSESGSLYKERDSGFQTGIGVESEAEALGDRQTWLVRRILG